MNRIFTTSILLASALALSGCGTDTPKGFVCPGASGLVDASVMTALRPGATDPSGALYRVDITRVKSACDYDQETGVVEARIAIDFTASRSPGGDSGQFTVPYFVGVSVDGTTIVEKRLYNVQFAFAPGQATASFSDRIDPFNLTPATDKKPTDYQMLVGLQLTKEQLDYNRRVGRFPQ